MTPDSIDLLMEDVLREVANPAPTEEFANHITHRSLAMNAAATSPSNLLMFSTLDRTAGRRMSPQSVGVAVLLNVAALLLLMVQVKTYVHHGEPLRIALVEPLIPPPAPPKLRAMGGGGGHPDSAPVSKGNPPKFAADQLNPPEAPPLEEPKVRIEPTVDVDPNVKMAKTDLLDLGMPNSPNVGTSLGSGRGAGLGSGNGSGIGPGSGGNVGGGIRRIGGGVAAPIVLFAPEPEFSEEARKAKASGNVLVYLQVDTNGRPMHVRVLRGIGLGLDEKAVEAVSHYKFKPAMENGHPVAVEMQVEVNFQVF